MFVVAWPPDEGKIPNICARWHRRGATIGGLMAGRASVVLVTSTAGYRGTGFLVDGPGGGVFLVTTLHTFVEIGPEPLVFPKQVTCTYFTEDGKPWEETLEWEPVNSNLNLLDDWVVFQVHDFRGTKRWSLTTALEPGGDAEYGDWACHGFPQGYDAGLEARGTLTTVRGWTGAYAETALAGEVPVLQLYVEQMAGAQVPAVGFSGAPIVIADRVVGLFRSFPPRGDSGGDELLAAGATVYANPIARVAEALGWPCPLLWSRADDLANVEVDRKERPPLRHKFERVNSRPSELLRAENQAIRFESEGRERELALLEEFAGGDLPYHVFSARGGSGKTRLLIEFCERKREEGWIAGFVPSDLPSDLGAFVRTLCAGRAPRLLVFDYVETNPQPAAKVIAEAVRAGAGRRIRVVLLSRDGLGDGDPAWWGRLTEASSVPEYRSAWIELSPMYEDLGARAAGFARAVSSFYGVAPAPMPDLDHELLARPLYLHGLALLCAKEELPKLENLTEHGILAEILRHERVAWTRWADPRSVGPGFHAAVGTIVTVATLLGECSLELADELAAGVIGRLDRSELKDAMDCVREVYGEPMLRPLEPDPLGEQLVFEIFEGVDVRGWFEILVDPARSVAQVGRALTVLTRLTTNRPVARGWLGELLREHGTALVKRIAAWAVAEQQSWVGSPGLALVNAAGVVIDSELAARFNGAIPEKTVELRELAVLSLEVTVATERKVDGGSDRLAGALNDLGARLSGLGRRKEALAAAEVLELLGGHRLTTGTDFHHARHCSESPVQVKHQI